MTTTFENAKVGDKAWDIRRGWGEIREIEGMAIYPLKVVFQNNTHGSFTLDGLDSVSDVCRTLFWDEVKIEAPQKPLPDLAVDTKVIVWNSIVPKTKRHFSHFSPEGKIVCFDKGLTSWTSDGTSEWSKWELAE